MLMPISLISPQDEQFTVKSTLCALLPHERKGTITTGAITAGKYSRFIALEGECNRMW